MSVRSGTIALDGTGPDDLVLPFGFFLHGDPAPVEWLTQHPGAIRSPATFVPNQSGEPPQLQVDLFEALFDDKARLADGRTASHDAPADSRSVQNEDQRHRDYNLP